MRQIVKPSGHDLEASDAQKRQSNTEQAALDAYYIDPVTRAQFCAILEKANTMTSNEKPPTDTPSRDTTNKGSPLLPRLVNLQWDEENQILKLAVAFSTPIPEHPKRGATDPIPPERDPNEAHEHSTDSEGEADRRARLVLAAVRLEIAAWYARHDLTTYAKVRPTDRELIEKITETIDRFAGERPNPCPDDGARKP